MSSSIEPLNGSQTIEMIANQRPDIERTAQVVEILFG